MRAGMQVGVWMGVFLAAAAWAGCASDDTATTGSGGATATSDPGGGGSGGDGASAGNGATGGGGATTTTICTATGAFVVGPSVEIDPATAFDTPQPGAFPSVASNGTLHYATWRSRGRLLGARLAADGTPLDVPAREIEGADGLPGTVVWDGAAFVVVWSTKLAGGYDLHMTRVDPATGDVAEPMLLAPGGVNAALASHGGVTLVAFDEKLSDGDLLALRLGPDGTPLDASPFVVAAEGDGWHPVAWDGSSFVTTWSTSAPNPVERRAARITPEGEVLDPGGVVVPFSGVPLASVGLGDGSVHAWTTGGGSVLYAMRLSSSLAPLDPAPVPVFAVGNSMFEDISSVSLSRSAAGDLAIGWILRTDILTENMAFARALSPTLAPVGASVKRLLPVAFAGQALVGLEGSDHLAVRTAEVLHAERLGGAGAGLSAQGERAIFLDAAGQDEPAIAGGPEGYMVVFREEDPAGGWKLRAKALDLEGEPTPAPAVTLETLEEGTDVAVARSASGYLVVRSGSAGIRVGRASPAGLETDVVLGTADARDVGIACQGDVCLTAWKEWSPGEMRYFAARLSADGALLDPAPVLLDQIAPPGKGPRVVAGGGAFGVFWSKGAVRIEADGALTTTPAFVPDAVGEGLPIAGSPTSFLSTGRDPITKKDWLDVLDLDGSPLGSYSPPDGLSYPDGAVWDGAAYLFLGNPAKAFLLTEDGTLAEPQAGLDLAYSKNAAIASASPGRAVVVRGVLGSRLSAQALKRADAEGCDP